MGLSAVVVVVLLSSLASLQNLLSVLPKRGAAGTESLEVYLERWREMPDESAHQEPDVSEAGLNEPENVSAPSRDEEIADLPERSQTEPPEDSQPPVADWYAAMDQVSRSTVAEHYRLQESRNAAWRNSTRSVLIQRGEAIVARNEEPAIEDFRFALKSRVLGIGINFGSCFFGVPIAGVPVEDRTGHITLVVCAKER